MTKTTNPQFPEPEKPWTFKIENLDSIEAKQIKALEDHLRGTEAKLSNYLHNRGKFGMVDLGDISLENFHKKVTDYDTLKMFIHYHYYLGKWAAYKTILNWLNENIYQTPITPVDEKVLAIARQFTESLKTVIVECPYCKKKVMNKDLLYYVDTAKNLMTRVCWECISLKKNKINTDYLWK